MYWNEILNLMLAELVQSILIGETLLCWNGHWSISNNMGFSGPPVFSVVKNTQGLIQIFYIVLVDKVRH